MYIPCNHGTARITGMQLSAGQVGLDVEMWLEMKFSRVEAACCITVDVWLSSSCVRLALSSGQEMPVVSAVSLMANEFPGGGVCMWVLMGWQQGQNRGEKEKKDRATRMLWKPVNTQFQGLKTGRAAFTTYMVNAARSVRQAVLSRL